MIYYTIELQSTDQGSLSYHAYVDDLNSAEKNYYTIMSAAVDSNVRKHGAIVIDENGNLVNNLVGMKVHGSSEESPFINYVIEMQSSQGSGALIGFSYLDQNDAAYSMYHNILSSAYVSNVYKHGSIILNEDATIVESKVAAHIVE